MNLASTPPTSSSWRLPLIVIFAGCLISMLGFGVRSTMGLFLEPMTIAQGWDRETFGLAMAIQNLVWGISVPVAGAFADRFGSARVIVIGALIYALGLWGMSGADDSMALHLFGGVLIGVGLAFTAFSLAMAAMARVVSAAQRPIVFGLGTASGSFGQFIFTPIGRVWIESYGWDLALILLASTTLAVIPLAILLPKGNQAVGEPENNQTIREAIAEATQHRGFILLTLGFFVCGYHVTFIGIHLPAYVQDLGLDGRVGAYALALIGLFNIFGSFLSGAAGQRWSKKSSLSWIYLMRGLVIFGLMLAPKTELTIYIFACGMGLLWLSTVPLTSAIVAQVFGMRYMATLFGIVFLSHQIGSFLGVWLGGLLFDQTGSYDVVWWTGAALGLGAAIVHWPINEKPLARLNPQTTN